MTLDLSQVKFAYDFFSMNMPDGSTLVLNNVNENFRDSKDKVTEVKQINVLVIDITDGSNFLCSSVIGEKNKYLTINSKYTEYLGKTLTEDNMQYCTIEINEETE